MTIDAKGRAGLYRLLSWASPSFPTGAFSFSHGLEAAAAEGAVHDRASLEAWVSDLLAEGSGKLDADILCAAYRAAAARDLAALDAANRRALAYRATGELFLETAQQGAAFLATCRAAWPDATLADWEPGETVCHSAAFGAVAAWAGIAIEDALLAYLQAFAANLVAAALRLGLIGQTDGQRILAAVEPTVARAVSAALDRDPADFGTATFAADLASMAHETQYSRLFQS